MDRDEALLLLRGGTEGIEEWNRRRASGETIPSLCDANLSQADLRKADLSNADLRRANLRKADLRKANLAEANLGGAKFVVADVIRERFLGPEPSREALNGADLEEADLREANLSKASLVQGFSGPSTTTLKTDQPTNRQRSIYALRFVR